MCLACGRYDRLVESADRTPHEPSNYWIAFSVEGPHAVELVRLEPEPSHHSIKPAADETALRAYIERACRLLDDSTPLILATGADAAEDPDASGY